MLEAIGGLALLIGGFYLFSNISHKKELEDDRIKEKFKLCLNSMISEKAREFALKHKGELSASKIKKWFEENPDVLEQVKARLKEDNKRQKEFEEKEKYQKLDWKFKSLEFKRNNYQKLYQIFHKDDVLSYEDILKRFEQLGVKDPELEFTKHYIFSALSKQNYKTDEFGLSASRLLNSSESKFQNFKENGSLYKPEKSDVFKISEPLYSKGDLDNGIYLTFKDWQSERKL